jgi:hypothetical protein
MNVKLFGSGEFQSTLNQKISSKPSRIVDFISRFVMIIESMNLDLNFIKSTNLDAKSTVLESFEPPPLPNYLDMIGYYPYLMQKKVPPL